MLFAYSHVTTAEWCRLLAGGSLAILLAGLTTDAAASTPPGSFPDSNVPKALRDARRHLYDPAVSALTMRSVEEVFETSKVAAGSEVRSLASAPKALDFNYRFLGETRAAAGFVEDSDTLGMLILKHGQIVFEYYGYKSRPDSKFQSSSMSKALTSMLVGIALDDGLIASIDDPVERYAPELEGTAYAGVSLRNLLRMRSGVDWDDSFRADGYSKRIQELSIFDNIARFTEAANWVKRGHAQGDVYNYSTLDSAVLGLVLRHAVGGSLAEYTARRLWQPAGMELDASWMLDGPEGIGHEFTGGGFNASLRDWGRLGQLMLDGGLAGDVQVLSEAWVAASTSCEAIPGQGEGYGYYWFCSPDSGTYTMRGGGGQFVYVDPARQTVIVKLSRATRETAERRYPRPFEERRPLNTETMAFFEAAAAWSPGR